MTYEEKLFAEAAAALRRCDCQTGTPEDGRLPFCLPGKANLSMDKNGTVYITTLYDSYENAADSIAVVRCVGHDVAEYMKALESAPDLKAGGLPDGYKRLAEYAGAVFAGHETRYGVEFITWERGADETLYYGHYFGSNYIGAKEDFAQRAGFAEEARFFNHDQLTELYRLCEQELAARYLPENRERLILGIQGQILRTNPEASVQPEQAETSDYGWDEEAPESIDIYFDDLSPQKQGEILHLLGENGNYDVFPLASIPVEQTEEPELTY